MAVKKLAALANDVQAGLPDNTEQLIKPTHVRTPVQDLLDSVVDAWGLLDITNNTVQVPLDTTPIVLTGVWTGSVVDPGMGVNLGAGEVLAFNVAGWNHIFQFVCTIAGTTNRTVTYRLRVNGVDTAVHGTVRLQGASQPLIVQLESFRQAAPAGAAYSLVLSADQPVTVSIPRGYMRIIRKPTQ